MVSIMRDTWMNMAKYTDEYYEFDKANSAYNRGGPESMLSMLNTNLDLALTDYVTVNFKALAMFCVEGSGAISNKGVRAFVRKK